MVSLLQVQILHLWRVISAVSSCFHIEVSLPMEPSTIARLSTEWASHIFRHHTAGLQTYHKSSSVSTRHYSLHNPLSASTARYLNSLRTQRRLASILCHAWRPSTAKKYASTVNEFLHFCSTHGVPLGDALPASESLLCAFAASFAGSLAGSSINNKMSALRGWHIQNDVPWHCGLQLKYILRGAGNMRPPIWKMVGCVSRILLDLSFFSSRS